MTALRRALVCFSLVALLGGCATVQRTDEPAPRDGPPNTFTARSPFEEPPGALSPAINQANIATTICVAGWTTTVRPPTSYTQSVKRHMLAQVGAPASEASQYELDHFVPLALGGNPTSLENLWLQRWLGSWNAPHQGPAGAQASGAGLRRKGKPSGRSKRHPKGVEGSVCELRRRWRRSPSRNGTR